MVPFHVNITVSTKPVGSTEKNFGERSPSIEKYVLGTSVERYEFRLGAEQIAAVLKSLEEIDCDFFISCRIFNSHYAYLAGDIRVWSEELRPIAEKAVIELARIAKRMTKQNVQSSAVIHYAIYREHTKAA